VTRSPAEFLALRALHEKVVRASDDAVSREADA
jgi:hypothetical protein